MSFEDFEALFALERETAKKEVKRRRPLPTMAELDMSLSLQPSADLSHSLKYDTALDTLPSDIVTSPTSRQQGSPRDTVKSPTVILRHKRVGRTSAPAEIGSKGFLSPIHSGTTPSGRGHPPHGEIAGIQYVVKTTKCTSESLLLFFHMTAAIMSTFGHSFSSYSVSNILSPPILLLFLLLFLLCLHSSFSSYSASIPPSPPTPSIPPSPPTLPPFHFLFPRPGNPDALSPDWQW